MVILGQTATNTFVVLARAWRGGGISTKSNFAREYADQIAVAASLGLITSQVSLDVFARAWFITPKGMDLLWDMEGFQK